jgi:hypothetical protein
MSPEQLEGQEADARSDLWALGCVLYEMATGRKAHEGASRASVISSIMRGAPRPLVELQPMTPPHLGALVGSCLAKAPEERWHSARDAAIVLAWKLPEGGGPASAEASSLQDRRFILTAAHVRQLAERNPRLVGYGVTYLDNGRESETLVVYLPAAGADTRTFEPVLRSSSERSVAVDLLGFSPGASSRPALSLDDHSRVLRELLRELVAEIRPERVVLVGFFDGGDQFLRMVHSEGGAGVEVAGLLALGANVSLETCFATRIYAQLDPTSPGGTLASLKRLAQGIESLDEWLVAQRYFSQTLLKLGTDIEPIRRYSAGVIAPFERPGDPFAEWYRSARSKIPVVRLVFARGEQEQVEALLSRHLETNVLGDEFTEDSLVIEPVHRLAMLDPALIAPHVAGVLAAIP